MIQHTLSLIDILTPPANQWLRDLSRCKTNLPAGVRVVRFGDGDDDIYEQQEDAATRSAPSLKKAGRIGA